MSTMTTQLNETLFRKPRTSGVQILQRRGESGAREMSTHRIRVEPGKTAVFTLPDEEAVVVLQEGRGTFSVGSDKWAVSRKDVFSERATALYLPVGDKLDISAETTIEAVAFSTPAPGGGKAALVRPDQVVVNGRGRGIYTREVHNIFVDDPHAKRLMVGETFNPPGHWSSYPPHKHDGRNGEPTLEEVYYYRVDPPTGVGLQLLYTADGENATHQVQDGDLVLLPYGYHPAAAPPGYRLYYLWALAGERRQLAVYEDPAYRWVHSAVS
jgi:5-deoxy-glucuronate isomerase